MDKLIHKIKCINIKFLVNMYKINIWDKGGYYILNQLINTILRFMGSQDTSSRYVYKHTSIRMLPYK